MYAELWEFDERKKRKESLIVRGTGVGSIDQFRTRFSELSTCLTGSNIIPDEIHCISVENSLYRVKIRNYSERSNLLQKAKNLNSHDQYRNVYINRDHTYRQRQELRDRRPNRDPNSSNFSIIGSLPQVAGAVGGQSRPLRSGGTLAQPNMLGIGTSEVANPSNLQ